MGLTSDHDPLVGRRTPCRRDLCCCVQQRIEATYSGYYERKRRSFDIACVEETNHPQFSGTYKHYRLPFHSGHYLSNAHYLSIASTDKQPRWWPSQIHNNTFGHFDKPDHLDRFAGEDSDDASTAKSKETVHHAAKTRKTRIVSE